MAKKDRAADLKRLKTNLQAFIDQVDKLKALPPGNREFGRIKSGLKLDLKKAGFDEESDEWKHVFGDGIFLGTGFFKDKVKQAEFEKIEYKKEVESLEDGASTLLDRLPD